MKIYNLVKKLKLRSKIVKNFEIENFSSLEKIRKNSLIFYEGKDLEFLKKKIKKRKDIIVILNKKLYSKFFINKIFSNSPRLTYFKTCEFLIKKKILNKKFLKKKIGKHCNIDVTAKIGNNVRIGNNVKIGANSVIDNCLILDNSIISDNCVIGTTGFGFFKDKKKIIANKHYGGVEIHKNVFIGPFSNIDRGHIDNTLVKDNVKIDAYVQVGHNSSIGKASIVTAGTIISGNVKIGKNVWVGPKTSIKERTVIGDNCLVGIGSNVVSNLKRGKTYFGNPAKEKI